MKRSVVSATVALVLLLGAAAALLAAGPPSGVPGRPGAGDPAAPSAAPTMFLTLSGETQGRINGGATFAPEEGAIEVWGWSHDIVSPRDAASGLPTGKRQHKPLVITKPIDKSSPLLMYALVSNENIRDLRLRFWRTDPATGAAQHYFTIELVNASIAGIRHNNETGVAEQTTEEVSFTYQKIIWTWEDGGITAEDDWESPVS